MWRRTGMIAAGFAMAASFGLAGAAESSAATPALHVKADSKWTAVIPGFGCEIEHFAANGTFKGDQGGDSGIWKGGGATLKMKWTSGARVGGAFSGTYTKSPASKYSGTFTDNGNSLPGKLVEGAKSGC